MQTRIIRKVRVDFDYLFIRYNYYYYYIVLYVTILRLINRNGNGTVVKQYGGIKICKEQMVYDKYVVYTI